MKKLFQGTYTAIITPLTAEDKIDWQAMERLIEKQIEGGITGIVFVGTTGESPTLSHEEHYEILRKSVKIADGRCQVIHGTGSNNTKEAIALARVSAESGADGQLVVNPYYNKPTQEGLFAHFSAIADATDLPIILYNIKGRSAINLETPTLLRLAKHPNIVGVKEASGDIAQITDVIEQTDDSFSCLSGDDAMTLPLMALGGDGVVSVISNVVPRAMSDMVKSAQMGNLVLAQQQFYQLLPLMRFSFMESNPIPVKELLAELGYCEPHMRLPLCRATQATQEAIQEMLTQVAELEPDTDAGVSIF